MFLLSLYCSLLYTELMQLNWAKFLISTGESSVIAITPRMSEILINTCLAVLCPVKCLDGSHGTSSKISGSERMAPRSWRLLRYENNHLFLSLCIITWCSLMMMMTICVCQQARESLPLETDMQNLFHASLSRGVSAMEQMTAGILLHKQSVDQFLSKKHEVQIIHAHIGRYMSCLSYVSLRSCYYA
jgi:hypothetical protein